MEKQLKTEEKRRKERCNDKEKVTDKYVTTVYCDSNSNKCSIRTNVHTHIHSKYKEWLDRFRSMKRDIS